jgi:hypothetical protein
VVAVGEHDTFDQLHQWDQFAVGMQKAEVAGAALTFGQSLNSAAFMMHTSFLHSDAYLNISSTINCNTSGHIKRIISC